MLKMDVSASAILNRVENLPTGLKAHRFIGFKDHDYCIQGESIRAAF